MIECLLNGQFQKSSNISHLNSYNILNPLTKRIIKENNPILLNPQSMTLTQSENQTQKTFFMPRHTYSNNQLKTPSDHDTNKLINKSIEKGRQTRFNFEKVLNFDYCLLIFSIINITLTIFYYEADYKNKQAIADFCLFFIFSILIIQVIVTVFRYRAQVALEKSQKILDEEENLVSSGKIYNVLIEIIILLLQPYPFLNSVYFTTTNLYDSFSFPFKINYVLVFLGFGKLFIILRVVLIRQSYMSPRSNRLCRMYGCESNYLYAVKCLFKDSPLSLIGIVFVCSILIFALGLRIAQRNLATEYPKHMGGAAYQGDIQDFENAVWLTIITMTTVGYGDFFPRTSFGRIIDVILVVWGTFVVSLMVVVLTNTLNMDQSQKRALIVLNRLQAKKALKQSAAFLITHSCKKYLLKKKISRNERNPLTDEEKSRLENTFHKHLTNFQRIHRVIRSMYEIDDVYQEMSRQFEFINDQVNFLISSQQDTIENLKNYLEKEDNRKK